MKIQRWRFKHMLMYPFAHNRIGEDVYEWLTAAVLGTQKGMSRKWAYWFREHVLLCRRYARTEFEGKRIWLLDPGWSLTPVILSRAVTSRGPLVTEDFKRLASRYCFYALAEAAGAGAKICRSAGIPQENLEWLKTLGGSSSPMGILRTCKADYVVGGLEDLKRIESESVDVCFSMGRLEHFSPADLAYLLGQISRILVPDGVASHIVDHRDHFWHYDKSIHCFHHLTFSDKNWEVMAKGRHLYRNRLLEPDYIELFAKADFEVLAAVHSLHREDSAGVDPGSLWGRFAQLTKKDLEAAVSHFVVRRK